MMAQTIIWYVLYKVESCANSKAFDAKQLGAYKLNLILKREFKNKE
jgi:hypothetical protein